MSRKPADRLRELVSDYYHGLITFESYREQRGLLLDGLGAGVPDEEAVEESAAGAGTASEPARPQAPLTRRAVTAGAVVIVIGAASVLAYRQWGPPPRDVPASEATVEHVSPPPPSPGEALLQQFMRKDVWNPDALRNFEVTWGSALTEDQRKAAQGSSTYGQFSDMLRRRLREEQALSGTNRSAELEGLSTLAARLNMPYAATEGAVQGGARAAAAADVPSPAAGAAPPAPVATPASPGLPAAAGPAGREPSPAAPAGGTGGAAPVTAADERKLPPRRADQGKLPQPKAEEAAGAATKEPASRGSAAPSDATAVPGSPGSAGVEDADARNAAAADGRSARKQIAPEAAAAAAERPKGQAKRSADDPCVAELLRTRLPYCRDVLKSGKLGPALVLLPAGQFVMGSDRAGEEGPTHSVTVAAPFAMSVHEVSFAEFDAYCRTAGKRCPHNPWSSDDYPVVLVSWNEAAAFTKWLSKETGYRYRLPSEAEWEYAARAGTTTDYPFGDEVTPAAARSSANGPVDTPVANADRSINRNAFRLFHMIGNVREWVADSWHDNYTGAPSDGGVWEGGTPDQRVVRGGSYADQAMQLRSSARLKLGAGDSDKKTGFRVVRELRREP